MKKPQKKSPIFAILLSKVRGSVRFLGGSVGSRFGSQEQTGGSVGSVFGGSEGSRFGILRFDPILVVICKKTLMYLHLLYINARKFDLLLKFFLSK